MVYVLYHFREICGLHSLNTVILIECDEQVDKVPKCVS